MSVNNNFLFAINNPFTASGLPVPFLDARARYSLKSDSITYESVLKMWKPSSTTATINRHVVRAMIELVNMKNGKNPNLGYKLYTVDSYTTCAVEYHCFDGTVYIADYTISDAGATSFRAVKISADERSFEPLDGSKIIKSGSSLEVCAFLYMPFLIMLANTNLMFKDIWLDALTFVEQNVEAQQLEHTQSDILVSVSHAFYCLIKSSSEENAPSGALIALFRHNTIGHVGLAEAIRAQTYSAANKQNCFGATPVLDGSDSDTTKNLHIGNSIAAYKEKFKDFNDQFTWTAEEARYIPQFPDDMPVPPEVGLIANAYVNTRDMKNPMVNFLWRGITSFGKSTGVKMLACILNRPLLHQTCSTNMEVQDFLSTFVPDNSDGIIDRPSANKIFLDPETAWKKLTGTEKDGVTSQECMDELVARASADSHSARFKHIESNYVKALAKGYIIEISEISRIREPGVLVGLNDYDQPGCVIPLVNGGTVERSRDALVVMTDNVGYVSCRPVDPAVIRRMAMVFDSYTMPKRFVLDRIIYNTGYKDANTLEMMYDTWQALIDYCKTHEITEGALSMTELERWVQMVMLENGNIYENCIRCVVAKATSNIDEQKELLSVLDTHIRT